MQVPKRTCSSAPQPALDDLEQLAARAVAPDEVEEVAYRLYENIRTEQNRVSGYSETRDELAAYQALVRQIGEFVSGQSGEDIRRIRRVIHRFNLGQMFRSGHGPDAYLIPDEFTDDYSPPEPRSSAAA